MVPGVLVVNADACLGSVTAHNLRRALEGVEVYTAGSCAEALILSHSHPPSVAVIDRAQPDGDGLHIIEDLTARIPDVRSILISAHREDLHVTQDLFGFLVKPYEIETLIDLVRRAITSRPYTYSGEGVRKTEASPQFGEADFHRVENRLQGLLAGLRAFGADLREVSDDSAEVQRAIDEYVDRLCTMVNDVAVAIKKGMLETHVSQSDSVNRSN